VIKRLAEEAIEFLEERDLVTIPPLAKGESSQQLLSETACLIHFVAPSLSWQVIIVFSTASCDVNALKY
jgi:hypothetical protein